MILEKKEGHVRTSLITSIGMEVSREERLPFILDRFGRAGALPAERAFRFLGTPATVNGAVVNVGENPIKCL